MIIRKLYRFEASHIVRNCSSDRCKYSVHGHSFRVELFLTTDDVEYPGRDIECLCGRSMRDAQKDFTSGDQGRRGFTRIVRDLGNIAKRRAFMIVD